MRGTAEPAPGQLSLPGLERTAFGPDRTVLHVGLDEFVVAVERRRHPELRGRPVVVGTVGDPARRGVVAGASPEAREYGIEAGVPLRTAAGRCPHAVFLPLDLRACRAAAREVAAVLRAFPGVWELVRWDEAFLEVDDGDPVGLAAAIQQRLAGAAGLTCTVGIGENKLQAKVASRLANPGGIVRLDSATWTREVGRLGPEIIVGVGPRRGRRLRMLGIVSVEQLAAADEGMLAAAFGPATGPALRRLAAGKDEARLLPRPPPRRTHGHEHTFEEDVADADAVRTTVAALARAVARDLRRRRRVALRVVVTLRFAPFETHSHACRVDRPSAEPSALEEAALRALDRFALGRPVRRVGVRADLVPAERRRSPRRRRPPGRQPLLEPYVP